MLLAFCRGRPGSYRSRERRGVISQKETQFYSKAQQQIPRSLNQHFQNIFRTIEFARKPHTGQDTTYALAAVAKYDEQYAQYAAEFHLRVR